MKVIIPAAGVGSRLRPYTYTLPKTLLPIAGKPILEYIIQQVIEWGATSLTIIHGHLGDEIKKYVKGRFDLEIDFRLQEPQLGLGHAIHTGIDPGDEDALVILGDTILDTDMVPAMKRGVNAIGVKEVDDPRKFGVVEVEGNKVIRLVEKPKEPPSNLAIVGVYYIRDAVKLKSAIKETMQKSITVKGEYQITDALQLLIDWGEVIETVPITGWSDCGNPETLLETNRYILKRDGGGMEGVEVKQSVIIPPVFIGEGAVIDRSIIGPYVSIGKNCKISETIIQNSMIGGKSIVQRAMISKTLIGYRAEVIGRLHQVNLGSSSWLKL
ncbi:MAG: NTP transferase domain-containing protein [Calditrichaeota bacterium]|jgi:glucose-1-phosphate thymidylyltransferase|nr:NTP transferase domain-containing protein [Calditrichota bacterium]